MTITIKKQNMKEYMTSNGIRSDINWTKMKHELHQYRNLTRNVCTIILKIM